MLRTVARSLLTAGACFAGLMALAASGFYPPLFRAGANFAFGTFGHGRIAKFEPLDEPTGMLDTRISVGSDARGYPEYPSSLRINCVREGFTPVAVILAVGLATPIAWPRKRKALVLALVAVHGFVALRVMWTLAYGFSRVRYGDRHLLEVGALGSWLLRRGDQILTGDLHFTFVAPLLIWLLIAIRPGDLRAFAAPGGRPAPPS